MIQHYILNHNAHSIEQYTLWFFLFFFFFIIFLLFVNNTKFIVYSSLWVNFVFLFSLMFLLCQNVEKKVNFDFTFFFLDNLSIIFLLMVVYIIPLTLLYTARNTALSIKPIILCILYTEFFVLLCFSSKNFFVFFISFELVLIPMFLLIFLYGSRSRKIYASFLFFVYTFVGSLCILISIAVLYIRLANLNFDFFIYGNIDHLSYNDRLLLLFLLMIGFMVKIPTMPFHNWLPEAHVEAPTVGSVILAAILLKLGGFGILRVVIPLLNDVLITFRIIPITLCIISSFYAIFFAFRHFDLKKIIAYSSIMHMNFGLIGLMIESKFAFIGSIISMLAHSLTSAGLFFIAGFLYEKYHTRNVLYYNNLYSSLNFLYILIFFFLLCNLAVPVTSAFLGELFLFIGVNVENFIHLIILFSIIFFFSGLFFCVLVYRLIYQGSSNINLLLLPENIIVPTYFSNTTLAFFSVSELLCLIILFTPAILLCFCSNRFIHLLHVFLMFF